MKNQLTWKISTGVLAVALLALNVAVPAWTKYEAGKKAGQVLDLMATFQGTTNPAQRADIAKQVIDITVTDNAQNARADIQASSGAFTTGGCTMFKIAALAVETLFYEDGTADEGIWDAYVSLRSAYEECSGAALYQ